jgi:hypothetical protein
MTGSVLASEVRSGAKQRMLGTAATAVTEALRLNPKLSIKSLLELGLRGQLLDALRKAGLPEE